MHFSRSLARRLLVLVLMGTLFVGFAPAPAAQAITSSEIRQSLQTKINNARAYRGLRRLRVSTYVCPAALLNRACMQAFSQNHAKKLAIARELFHDTPYRLWREVPVGAWWRAENVGYVGQGRGAAARVHRAFMASSGHRANILKPRATHMAVGVQQTRTHVWFVERFVDAWPLP